MSINKYVLDIVVFRYINVDLIGLGVTCSPRDPRFAGSNPESEISDSLKNLTSEKISL